MIKHNVQRLAGYTIDQTILIVSVIAVLVTMIIGSVGWDLLTRAGATKLVSHLRQVEQANGQFYAAHGVWPQDAIGSLDNALCALVDPGFVGGTPVGSIVEDDITGKPRNLLPAYTHNCRTANGADKPVGSVNHTTSEGLAYMRAQDVASMGDTYLVLQFQGIAVPEVVEADKVIDGDSAGSPLTGRIRFDASAKGKTDLYFIANIVDTETTTGTDFTITGE